MTCPLRTSGETTIGGHCTFHWVEVDRVRRIAAEEGHCRACLEALRELATFLGVTLVLGPHEDPKAA